MKTIANTVFIILLSMTITEAQPNQTTQLSLNSGYALPAAPSYFTDYWAGGISLGAGYTLPVYQNLSALIHIQYNNFMFDEDAWKKDLVNYMSSFENPGDTESMIVNGGMKDIVSLSLSLKYALPVTQKFFPYVLGGAGAMFSTTDNISIGVVQIEFENEWTYMGAAGIGLEYVLRNDLNVFLELSYIYGETKQKNKSELPIDLTSEYQEEPITFYYLKLGFAYNLNQ